MGVDWFVFINVFLLFVWIICFVWNWIIMICDLIGKDVDENGVL